MISERKKVAACVPTSRQAFTLIETVLAVALFASAAVVLTSSFVNALMARELGNHNTLLEGDLRAVRLQLLLEPNREDAEDGDEIETLNSGKASWRAVIEPTQVVDLFKVELQVEFLDPPEDSPSQYQETLYLLRPTWSESDERDALLQDKRDALLNSRDSD